MCLSIGRMRGVVVVVIIMVVVVIVIIAVFFYCSIFMVIPGLI